MGDKGAVLARQGGDHRWFGDRDANDTIAALLCPPVDEIPWRDRAATIYFSLRTNLRTLHWSSAKRVPESPQGMK